jgi:hypothetical protein
MSVIAFRPEDIGALAWSILSNDNYRSAFLLDRDRLDTIQFKMDTDSEDHRIKCFFERLYLANQLAYFTTYQEGLARSRHGDLGIYSFLKVNNIV